MWKFYNIFIGFHYKFLFKMYIEYNSCKDHILEVSNIWYQICSLGICNYNLFKNNTYYLFIINFEIHIISYTN